LASGPDGLPMAENSTTMDERIIGEYHGQQDGPLLICFGGMHGNETAGVEALTILFHLLAEEPNLNPHFRFFGHMIGLRGNLRALAAGERYVQKDLNRQWTPANIQRIRATPRRQLEAEELEISEILEILDQRVAEWNPEKIYFLDLHTTTAYGGIFSIATDDPESVRLGVEMHAPVIKGLLRGIRGTTMHYFNSKYFHPNTVAVTFESGQHQEKLSVNRALAATINCMRTIGLVLSEDVENRHDKILRDYCAGLPKVAEFIMRHTIEPEDGFQMRPGYKNFQPVRKGEILAYDRHGPIRAIADGRVLMPLYQKQGEDGFFLIKAVEQPQLAEEGKA